MAGGAFAPKPSGGRQRGGDFGEVVGHFHHRDLAPQLALHLGLRDHAAHPRRTLQVAGLFNHQQMAPPQVFEGGHDLGHMGMGQIAQIGTPQEIYDRPATRFVADFVGSSNVLPPELTRALGGPAEWASLRPEATRLAATGPVMGTVTGLRYLGAGTRVQLSAHGAEIAALIPAGQPVPEPGANMAISFDPGALHLMGGE